MSFYSYSIFHKLYFYTELTANYTRARDNYRISVSNNITSILYLGNVTIFASNLTRITPPS